MRLTLVLACFFTLNQVIEYSISTFHINDSAYGSVFYLITGFHGFHVVIGSLFILANYLRISNPKKITFTKQQHFGFLASLWYWHFVDVVWIFVFFFVYI
jgi:cytochrome c oxidase subunit 3